MPFFSLIHETKLSFRERQVWTKKTKIEINKKWNVQADAGKRKGKWDGSGREKELEEKRGRENRKD